MNDKPDLPAPLSIDDFADYYRALYGYRPFQWQERLAKQVCRGDWPEYIKLPTSSGKTAAIDIAVFALAFQAANSNRPQGTLTAPRRIFFVVDRRIIVNEAYRRARRAAELLRDAINPAAQLDIAGDARQTLTRVAGWLHNLAADATAPPLDCFELRGGIYRDDAWVRSPLQPTVLTSTVDQVGSRLLFRGYGVSDRNLPIHAALTANDSLIILDEAHCSKPFSQTMEAIERYRGANWAQQVVETPLRFVQMTATPPPNATADKVLELDPADYEANPLLEKRHGCSKPVNLVPAGGAKGKKLTATLAKKLVEQAEALYSKHGLRKIAIVVNRVAIAREVFALLDRKHADRTTLMIGRMRPCDRDRLTTTLQREFGSGWAGKDDENVEASGVPPQFVVATQCLEVGADLDFDGIVSQCASLDALRQRFGRLNRLGESPHARGVIVAAEGDIAPLEKLDDAKPLDPIYGNALARTWHWMQDQADTTPAADDGEPSLIIDFGVKALNALCSSVANVEMRDLSAPAPDAPVLMPAHVDMLCQTSPRPTPEPDVAAYLHGPNRDSPEVRVCWRADLDLSVEEVERKWIDAVDLCPPSSAECLSVPLHVFRRWLRGDKAVDQSGDVLGESVEAVDEGADRGNSRRTVLVWRGPRRKGDESERSFLASANNVRRVGPNDTVVIPAEFGGWKALGHIPQAPPDPADDDDVKNFPTTEPRELHRMLMNRDSDFAAANGNEDAEAAEEDDGAPAETTDVVRQLAAIDVGDRAFLQARSRTIWRIHLKLPCEQELDSLRHALLKEAAKADIADLGFTRWRRRAEEIRTESESDENLPTDVLDAPRLVRLTAWQGKLIRGQIRRYPNALVWITERHPRPSLSLETLPLAAFGDDDDSLSLTGLVSQSEDARQRLPLSQHLADVAHEASRLCEGLSVRGRLANAVVAAAKFHDIGKADPRFQAMLLSKPLSVAFMQRQLWAKSDGTTRGRATAIPDAFRHEMLSLSLLDHFEPTDIDIDEELLQHEVAAHHGYARPFAPLCIDDDPPGLDLRPLGGIVISKEERGDWIPAHRLDSGIAERFWALNRCYGWWGLAYLESLLRLADWKASAEPGCGNQPITLTASSRRPAAKPTPNSLTLTGIDGSNPLGFLAAVGAFRVLAESMPEGSLWMKWQCPEGDGAWRPVLCCGNGLELTCDDLVSRLDNELRIAPDSHPALRTSEMVDLYGTREAFCSSSVHANLDNRIDADWLSCNGSDVVSADSISQLQTTRRDYHAINIRGLVTTTTTEHLRRALFLAWDYSDPIAGVSLHLEPREDRRHAYQWHMPSGDPTRSSCGGMIGANRLALESWPLFQSLPDGERLTTVGFRGNRANNTSFAWPIWAVPIDLTTLSSLLSLARLHVQNADARELAACGISVVYRSRRILVGKTPNLTSSVAALA